MNCAARSHISRNKGNLKERQLRKAQISVDREVKVAHFKRCVIFKQVLNVQLSENAEIQPSASQRK